jgi:tyrosine-protein phosphatase OCA1
MKLVPPNFGMVEEDIFRCGAPSPIHYPFLEGLALRTCIVLSDQVDETLVQWLHENRIMTLFPAAAGADAGGYGTSHRGSMTLPEPTVIELLQVLLDPVNYPVLVTCSTGRYRTGITLGCLRKLQGWNMTSILEEYRRFAGVKGRIENEEFMELFDVDSVTKVLPGGRKPSILYPSIA